jgi:Family of unknown function (DUF6328)
MDERQFPEFEREWIEFLTEVRTTLPGVQLLFGFLLTVPFAQSFVAAPQTVRVAYLACFLTTACACAFLIAPSVYHRLHWRRDVHDKEEMLKTCNRLAIVGSALLVVSMTSAIFCVLWMLFPHELAVAVTVLSSGIFVWLWFGLPLMRRIRDR